MRDIGFHFSDRDPQFKGIDSSILLENVMKLIEEKQFYVINLDSTVILETPKLSSYIPLMQERISQLLKIPVDCVSIKATTHELVDSFGLQHAIKAYATVLLNKG